MRSELVNTPNDMLLSISVDEENHWIVATWQGDPTPEAIRNGMEAYLETLVEAHYDAVLIDTRSMDGVRSFATYWALEEWVPKAVEAGLHYYAVVVNPETFAEAAADDFYANISSFEAEVFADLATARAWLRRCRLQQKQADGYLTT
ncbi:STAS/SEC14 domain-containing protein [Rufibacter tibetensis]|uniref:STAS/SEC14 domain-containing protein n=1 Tax=Rufibacter tibetensis TaxID=512763 RepID=A0A0P0CP22_9BACT|nr:STAS/SEC14 domain-containing protein [Rufibacter tibetensis]ALI98953.1 hypothetical protein DC20_08150 [Rufibacter tibetensis]